MSIINFNKINKPNFNKINKPNFKLKLIITNKINTSVTKRIQISRNNSINKRHRDSNKRHTSIKHITKWDWSSWLPSYNQHYSNQSNIAQYLLRKQFEFRRRIIKVRNKEFAIEIRKKRKRVKIISNRARRFKAKII